ncbi:PfkB family carbohydrate kinase [Mucisphaera sp.]|uniref:PfkB family carbohydrate kinase n=1 Tax=Mucisphaera sp. TaxID=2913024 RepID=UPI003D1270D5
MADDRLGVVTFGEIMLRLSTPGFTRFTQTNSLDVTFGGGEANVAASLSQFGIPSRFVCKLPEHEIGQAAVNHLRRFGVDTDYVVRGGDRIGIYFLETGASQRASKVIYDRAAAAVTTLRADELNLDGLFAGVGWFHWTGITPALGEQAQKTLAGLLEAAKQAGCRVSCDLNFRKKLWTTEQAQAVMRPLMEQVDVCIANEEDAEKSLGISPDGTDVTKGELDLAGYGKLAERLKAEFSFDTVAITLRESHSASRNGWSAIMLDDKACSTATRSKVYDVQLVDRVGGGDSFAAGLIYGLLSLGDTRRALEFAVAASCLKQTIPGDFNLVSADEVLKLAGGDGSGRVER